MRFLGREAVQIENDRLRVTVLCEGGHIAEILHKPTGINPLWIPPWRSIEPSAYSPAAHPEYGSDAESKLLAGIMGHNLCLDLFGPPSDEEAEAGITVHGEASVAPYRTAVNGQELEATAQLESAGLSVSRTIRLAADEEAIHITETVANLGSFDRPIAWTQHVTMGPPFIEGGVTQFSAPATRSRVYDGAGFGAGGLKPGADYDWPHAPLAAGGVFDQRVFTAAPRSAKFTSHLMNAQSDVAYFAAYQPTYKLLFGYRWRRADFPWLGIWEEKCDRQTAPWNGNTVTIGMEFGVSPVPEPRRKMIDRRAMFDEACYRWIPARSRLTVRYEAILRQTGGMPAAL